MCTPVFRGAVHGQETGKEVCRIVKQKTFFWELDSLIVKVFRVRKYYSNSKVYSLSTVHDNTVFARVISAPVFLVHPNF